MKKAKSEKKKWTGMPSGTDLETIKSGIESTYDPMREMENLKEQIKDVYDDLHAKTGIPKRIFNFLMKNNYFGNGLEVLSKNSEIQDAYEAVTK